jgi:hypothetical protein
MSPQTTIAACAGAHIQTASFQNGPSPAIGSGARTATSVSRIVTVTKITGTMRKGQTSPCRQPATIAIGTTYGSRYGRPVTAIPQQNDVRV